MPSLTVKAVAEMINMPAHEQLRILAEQKHPKAQPQVFRTPFYQPALSGIRNFYRSGGNGASLRSALVRIQSLSSAPRRNNNARVLSSFEECPLALRPFALMPNARIAAKLGNVEFRLSPDFRVVEGDAPKVLYLNCRAEKTKPEGAELTAEVAYWVLRQNGIDVPISSIEYFDLFTKESFVLKKPRKSTEKKLGDTAQVIDALWESIK